MSIQEQIQMTFRYYCSQKFFYTETLLGKMYSYKQNLIIMKKMWNCWQWCWWLYVGHSFKMLVTASSCWWLFLLWKNWWPTYEIDRQHLKLVTYMFLSPTLSSYTGHRFLNRRIFEGELLIRLKYAKILIYQVWSHFLIV